MSFRRQKGVRSFSEVVSNYSVALVTGLKKEFPLAEELLDIVVMHIPPPTKTTNATYQMSESSDNPAVKELMDAHPALAKSIVTCDPSGPTMGVVVDLTYDNHVGLITYVRVLSGILKKGISLHTSGGGG